MTWPPPSPRPKKSAHFGYSSIAPASVTLSGWWTSAAPGFPRGLHEGHHGQSHRDVQRPAPRGDQHGRSNDEIDGERGVCVLTASIAGFEGQIGQIAYSSSKGGVVGMTLVAARDLARSLESGSARSRRDHGHARCSAASCATTSRPASPRPCPIRPRLGNVDEFADLAATIVRNGYLNGETIRLDGALRMAPR